MLLFQDLAVVPVLFAIGAAGRHGASGGRASWAAIGQAVLAWSAIVGVGRLVLRPLFRSVARTGSPELFVAACLLVIIATGLATAAVGLSMALGSLIAGLLLAETEFRRQIEVTIEPFKGLLLGVFLISVGMSLDLRHRRRRAGARAGRRVVLVALKLAIDRGPRARLRPALADRRCRPDCCSGRAASSASSSWPSRSRAA